MKLRLMFMTALLVVATQARANETTVFREVGKIIENTANHTQRHDHALRFQRFSDGKEFDIVDSPELVELHCKTGTNPVMEVEGYRTDKVLFWGGNLVVNNFTVHDDIAVPAVAHRSAPVAAPRGGGRTRL